MPLPAVLRSVSALRTPDAAAPVEARVQSGDLWQLGRHRLLCADCTDAAAVMRLMRVESGTDAGNEAEDAATADMLFLDPPYGVDYSSARRKAVSEERPLVGDALGEHGTYDLLKRALSAAPLKPGGAFYVCSAGGTGETLFRLALRDANLPLKQSLVWVKHHFVLGRSDFHWQHETLLYGWKPGAGHYFGGGRTQTTVWEYKRPHRSRLHPTMKPLDLVERAVMLSSKEGELVYDGFGGSGTTLLACEATGRKCRMVEIAPCYCDVIVQRWEEATGRRAVCLARQNAC